MRVLHPRHDWKWLLVLSLLTGLLYNSWPLGYLFNPRMANALASNLEGTHQPYNWIFSGGDIVSSLLFIVIIVFLFWRYGRAQRWLYIVMTSCFVFSACTIVDTALPLRCIPGAPGCASFTHNPLLLLHGIFSIVASIGLFIAFIFIWRRFPANRLMKLLILSYTVFGLMSLFNALSPTRDAFSQHFYITLCSCCLIIIPLALSKSLLDAG